MQANKLREEANCYGRKQFRKRVIGIYKSIKKHIKRLAKNGKHQYSSRYVSVYDELETFTAFRLFVRKHPDFRYRWMIEGYDVDNCDKFSQHLPLNYDEYERFKIIIFW